MITIDFNMLNPLERSIHETLSAYSKTHQNIRIKEAAEICTCSVSKISKFTKKLGFTNYKQYLDFLYGKEIEQVEQSSELTRLEHFIRDFDSHQVDEMIELIQSHEKIVLFGYGPSLVCAQYIEYRLRTCINKVIIAVSDDVSVASMTDEHSLLLIFTVTGSFQSFEKIYHDTKAKGGEVVIVVEEYNTQLFSQCDKIFLLSHEAQPSYLLPYEKSRTIFFIFMEEVMQKLTLMQKSGDGLMSEGTG
ncbi:MAG: MurR/RpiR family transcriptional regulator [Sphaerochaetaceae bacterium]|nr:MurR/RpiR family transcriptional regulator [Sphaerochaetaceae bacterium]